MILLIGGRNCKTMWYNKMWFHKIDSTIKMLKFMILLIGGRNCKTMWYHKMEYHKIDSTIKMLKFDSYFSNLFHCSWIGNLELIRINIWINRKFIRFEISIEMNRWVYNFLRMNYGFIRIEISDSFGLKLSLDELRIHSDSFGLKTLFGWASDSFGLKILFRCV